MPGIKSCSIGFKFNNPVVEDNMYLICPSEPKVGADVKFKIDPVVV